MNIGVIMGGISSEREVSIKIGKDIIKKFDKNKYKVKEILINNKKDIYKCIDNIDFAFLSIPGEFGEDGTIQSILESMDIPYSGCGVLSSATCMNKDFTKSRLITYGINTPKWTSAKSIELIDFDAINNIGYPIVVKPNNGGSSIDTFLVNDDLELKEKASLIIEKHKCAIMEEYIEGKEYSIFILDGRPFMPVYIDKEGIYDYNDKYVYSSDIKCIKKTLDLNVEKNLKSTSRKVWDSLDCEVYARVDVILKDNKVYVLEVNTLPSLAEGSSIDKAINYENMQMQDLLDKIINISLNKK